MNLHVYVWIYTFLDSIQKLSILVYLDDILLTHEINSLLANAVDYTGNHL